MKTFEGSMTALATPFKDGKLDEASFRAPIERQIAGGTRVLIPMGTTGEAVTMTSDERARAIEVTVEAAKGRVPVVAGRGLQQHRGDDRVRGAARGSWARTARSSSRRTTTSPPSRACCSTTGPSRSAHPGFPLVAYNVPGRTGVDLLPETVMWLCDIPEVVALKEATGNMARAMDLVEKCGDRITLLSGR